ncbi:hypothetical protein L7F22_026889 [Adiantum nelumboides]|nr:hypothetical protein [Adiantum nelumboides]
MPLETVPSASTWWAHCQYYHIPILDLELKHAGSSAAAAIAKFPCVLRIILCAICKILQRLVEYSRARCNNLDTMYETRHQTALLQQDENKREEMKAAAKGVGLARTQVQAAPVNNRRALGDIGNLVGAAAAEGHTELQNMEKKAPLPVVDRPVTRGYGARLAENFVSGKEEYKALEEASAAMSQMTLLEQQEDSGDVNVPPGFPARNKENGRAKRAAIAGRKGRTLTATLTAQSEAACGVFKAKVVENPVTNIDADDVGNQLAVVDYIEDIYSFYRRTEKQSCVPPDYMSQQVHINEKMRAVLVDWLIEVHYKYRLMPETLFLTTNLIDRYLALKSVERKSLQLVGMTAMLIASKYEEIWAPEIKDLILISDNAYTRQQILDMEKVMLNVLRFNLCIPTPYMFLVRFLKAAGADRQMSLLAFYFVELCLVDYAMLGFLPSMLAASAVYLARNTLKSGQEARWSTTLSWHSGYQEAQLIECASLIVDLHKKAGDGNVMVVHRKYAQTKFYSVALLNPPTIVVSPK